MIQMGWRARDLQIWRSDAEYTLAESSKPLQPKSKAVEEPHISRLYTRPALPDLTLISHVSTSRLQTPNYYAFYTQQLQFSHHQESPLNRRVLDPKSTPTISCSTPEIPVYRPVLWSSTAWKWDRSGVILLISLPPQTSASQLVHELDVLHLRVSRV